jgi:alginate O-acetyltransferase complex protein AlgI
VVFSSVAFIFYFLPVFLVGYYVSGWRAGSLLVGSAAFYVWGEGPYVALLGALIVVNYAGSLMIAGARTRGSRFSWLITLVVADFAVLAWFKYAGFLAASVNHVLPGDPLPAIKTTLPLGISFFTFQLVSYVVDVHRGTVKVERDPVRFAAYILMFPHLIAGPIVRYADIRDEMHADRRNAGHIGLGVQYFIVGLAMKVLIANTVAALADHAFGLDAADLTATGAWLGAWAYALQIYFDFCGYSYMAIGLAFMLGFTFPKNFDYPYIAQSVTDFWRRWHISLSSWFRDYVYIPLGGNRGGTFKTVRNLLIVFFLTGLWHGAAWQFIVWGLFHGAFLMIERFGLGALLARAPRVLRHAYLLLVVTVGWVFFRAGNLGEALIYLKAMFDPAGFAQPDLPLTLMLNTQTVAALFAGTAFAAPLMPWLMERLRAPRADEPSPVLSPRLDTRAVHALPVVLLAAGFLVSVAALVGSSLNPFLYFRF